MNRGVNRHSILGDDGDREYFSKTVAEYKELCGARVYHWVWMGNHYHMLVEVVHENLRGFAGGIQQAYAQYHHARYDGCGVFWQGRFKSKPVEIGPYLASCGRYIERNPVRAGLAVMAWEYKWSSAAAYVKKAVDGVTDENPYMGPFADSDRVVYGERLMSGVDEKVVREVEGDRAIGSKEFAATLKMERGRYRVKRGRPVMSV
jgi:putative transposase